MKNIIKILFYNLLLIIFTINLNSANKNVLQYIHLGDSPKTRGPSSSRISEKVVDILCMRDKSLGKTEERMKEQLTYLIKGLSAFKERKSVNSSKRLIYTLFSSIELMKSTKPVVDLYFIKLYIVQISTNKKDFYEEARIEKEIKNKKIPFIHIRLKNGIFQIISQSTSKESVTLMDGENDILTADYLILSMNKVMKEILDSKGTEFQINIFEELLKKAKGLLDNLIEHNMNLEENMEKLEMAYQAANKEHKDIISELVNQKLKTIQLYQEIQTNKKIWKETIDKDERWLGIVTFGESYKLKEAHLDSVFDSATNPTYSDSELLYQRDNEEESPINDVKNLGTEPNLIDLNDEEIPPMIPPKSITPTNKLLEERRQGRDLEEKESPINDVKNLGTEQSLIDLNDEETPPMIPPHRPIKIIPPINELLEDIRKRRDLEEKEQIKKMNREEEERLRSISENRTIKDNEEKKGKEKLKLISETITAKDNHEKRIELIKKLNEEMISFNNNIK